MTKRPKPDEPTALALLEPARKTHEAVKDFNPMVLYAPRHGQAMMAVIESEGVLHELLADLLGQMRAKLGPAQWIAVTIDVYARVDGYPGEIGGLAEAFADGDPKVVEQIMVMVKRRNQPVETAVQTYRYLPSEGYEWDEAEVIEDQQGSVPDVLNFYI